MGGIILYNIIMFAPAEFCSSTDHFNEKVCRYDIIGFGWRFLVETSTRKFMKIEIFGVDKRLFYYGFRY